MKRRYTCLLCGTDRGVKWMLENHIMYFHPALHFKEFMEKV